VKALTINTWHKRFKKRREGKHLKRTGTQGKSCSDLKGSITEKDKGKLASVGLDSLSQEIGVLKTNTLWIAHLQIGNKGNLRTKVKPVTECQ